MKKFVIKISLVFIGIAFVFLVFLGLRLRGEGVPAYRFLAGRNPAAVKKVARKNLNNVDTVYTYSFEADFNDVCSKADAELIGAGFAAKSVAKILSGNESRERNYFLKERFPRGPVRIVIYNNHAYIEKYSAVGEKDGWVVVEIACWKGWRLY